MHWHLKSLQADLPNGVTCGFLLEEFYRVAPHHSQKLQSHRVFPIVRHGAHTCEQFWNKLGGPTADDHLPVQSLCFGLQERGGSRSQTLGPAKTNCGWTLLNSKNYFKLHLSSFINKYMREMPLRHVHQRQCTCSAQCSHHYLVVFHFRQGWKTQFAILKPGDFKPTSD